MSRRGSFTVEAAIVFPIFIFLWVPFLYLMNYCYLYETMQEDAYQRAVLAAQVGYLFDRAGLKEIQDQVWEGQGEAAEDTELVPQLMAEQFVRQFGENAAAISGAIRYCMKILSTADSFSTAISREGWKLLINEVVELMMGKPDEQTRLAYSEYFYKENGYTDNIAVVEVRELPWGGIFPMLADYQMVGVGKVRAFIGIRGYADDSETGEDTEDTETYYRIGNGTRYHSIDCYLIAKDVQRTNDTNAAANGYSPCEGCHPGSGIVYLTWGGERYHTRECSHLFPQLTALTPEELASGRYQPCALCQTEGGWFSSSQ